MAVLQGQRGFSLIEIIVALSIVSIMAVGAFGAFRYIQQGKVTKTQAILADLRTDLERFRSDVGRYPQTLEDLTRRPSDPELSRGWRMQYREDVPFDAWHQEFVYEKRDDKGSRYPYELYSWGKNGVGSPEDEWISVWRVDE